MTAPGPKSRDIICRVVEAILHFNDRKGSTMAQIKSYISIKHDQTIDATVEKRIVEALRRGVRFGVISKQRGHFKIENPEQYASKHCPGHKHKRKGGKTCKKRRRRQKR